MFKFENLEIWKLSLDYVDLVYKLTERLPKTEEYNLKSQIIRAATSVSLNIAEESMGQTNFLTVTISWHGFAVTYRDSGLSIID